MIVGFSSRGTGGGSGPVDYLTDEKKQGRDEKPPVVVRGSPESTERLIDSLDFKYKYTSGVLSFSPEDDVSESMEKAIMDRFESVAFAGLEADQYNILWVRHEHANHHELHFVVPRVELSSGKSLNIRPPGELSKQTFDDFRSEINARYGFADPDDPRRAREVSQPNHLLKIAAEALRSGDKPKDDVRLLVNEIVAERAVEGLISNRSEVIAHIKELGFDVSREGKNYITIMEPDSGEKWRLKGGLYERDFDATRAIETEAQRTTREYGKPDAGAAVHFAQRVEKHISSRAQYHKNRYAAPIAELGIRDRRIEEPSHLESDQRSDLVSSPDRSDSLGDYLSIRLGVSALADKPVSRQPERDRYAERDTTEYGEQDIWDRLEEGPERYVRSASEGEFSGAGVDSWQSASNQDHEVSDDRARKPLTERIAGFISTIQRATRELKEHAEHIAGNVRAHFEGKRDIVKASRELEESDHSIKQANESICGPVQSEHRIADEKEKLSSLNQEIEDKTKDFEYEKQSIQYPSMEI